MSLHDGWFLLVLALGCWAQTVTGFGLGMLVMGLNGAFGLVPFPVAASVTGAVQLVQGVVALRGRWATLPRAPLMAALAGMLPAVLVGVALLHALPPALMPWMQGALGLLIALGALQWFVRPQVRERPSPRWAFALAGAASGLMGGLVSVAGPPVIHQGYRQPWPLAVVRRFLIALFFVLYALRSAVDVALGGWRGPVVALVLAALPLAALATQAGRRWHPPLSDAAMRRLVAAVLLVLGLYLIAAAPASA